jgi:hypothetical protein
MLGASHHSFFRASSSTLFLPRFFFRAFFHAFFHVAEIIAADPAVAEDEGDWGSPDAPWKPDSPRKWESCGDSGGVDAGAGS